MDKKIKTAVLGMGLSGQVFHVPFLKENAAFAIKAVLSSNVQICEKLLPGVKRVTTLDEILTLDIDLVVITTPNSTHFPFAKKILESGRDVVIEKPFTNTSNEAMALQELAQKNKKNIFVFQNRRLDGDFLTVKSLIKEKAFGELSLFESHFDRYSPQLKGNWRETQGAGHGVFFDLGAHLLDQFLDLFGTPEAITADLAIQRDNAQVDDYFHIIFHYKQMRAIAHGSCLAQGPKPRFIIHGKEASFIKYGLDPQESALRQGQSPGEDGFGEDDQSRFGELFTPTHRTIISTQKGLYSKFYSYVAAGDPMVELSSAVKLIQLIEIAIQSAQQQKTLPVSL
jgi:scyllo-inositol 2-dehydrogenase (NADP+)